MVWEASQKGVPFLGVPGNSLKDGVFLGNPKDSGRLGRFGEP